MLSRVLNTPEIDVIMDLSSKVFHNTLMHHGSNSDTQVDVLTGDVPFYGLVQQYYNGYGYQNLKELVTEQIARAAVLLNEWASK